MINNRKSPIQDDYIEKYLAEKELNLTASLNIQNLIDNAEVKPEECVSRFNHSRSYKPGSIIVNGDALLLAFATLNKAGRAKFFTQDEYIECLSEMWKQIEVHCSQTDVCVPILGSGLTLFEGASLSQQELLNIMIWSYKLSPRQPEGGYDADVFQEEVLKFVKTCDLELLNQIQFYHLARRLNIDEDVEGKNLQTLLLTENAFTSFLRKIRKNILKSSVQHAIVCLQK